MGCRNKELSNEYIKIKQYQKIEIEKIGEVSITEDMVTEVVSDNMTVGESGYHVTDRGEVVNGDKVIVDMEGRLAGSEEPGESLSDEAVIIGSGQYVQGFEEQIIGHLIGETFNVEVTFPEPYEREPSLAGQSVVYTITIKTIFEQSEVLADDNEEIREQLEAEMGKRDKELQFAAIESKLIENTEVIKYPKGKSEKDLLELIIELIAEEEDLVLNDKKFDEKLDEYALVNGYKNGEEVLSMVANEEKMREKFQEEVVLEWLLEHAKEID